MKQGQKQLYNGLITTRRKTEKNTKKGKNLLPLTYRPKGPNEREKMTKQNRLTVKLAILTTLGIGLTFFLGNNAMTNTNGALAFGSQLGAVVVGIFSALGLIATLVYLLTEDGE
jgi:hypothetical protein